MVTEHTVREALREVFDPEIPINVVDLGLIYRIQVEGRAVSIDMTLTGRGCPLHALMAEMVRQRVARIPGVEEVRVNVVWDPPWHPGMMAREVQIRYGFLPPEQGVEEGEKPA